MTLSLQYARNLSRLGRRKRKVMNLFELYLHIVWMFIRFLETSKLQKSQPSNQGLGNVAYI